MPSAKRCLSIVIMVLAVIFNASPALNGAGEGEAARGSRAPRLEPDFRPRPGTSHYLFELNGVNIGTGWISTQKEGELYKIRYQARTNRRVDRLYKARYTGEGIMEADPLKPLRAELHQRVKSKTKETNIYFEDNGRIITTETKTEEGEEPENEVRETRAEGIVLDPFSAVLLLQGIDWELGKEKVFEVYTGNARYETRFTCVGEADVESAGTQRTAWVITHVSRKLDEEQEEQPEQKRPGLRIYVSAEGNPDVLKVETTRKVGKVTLTLDRFDPAPKQAPR
jgi:hypothetical protein